MKKNILKLLALFLVFIMPVTFVNASSDENVNDIDPALKDYLGDNYEEKIKKNTESAQNIEKIQSMFNNTNARSMSNEYPDYIGGLYIDSQDDNMVIQIVKNNIPSSSENAGDYSLYNNILSIDEDAKIEYVDYSYNEINEVIDILADYYSKNYENGYIDGYYDDLINNRVVVELKNYSKESILDFKKYVLDSNLIYFTESRNVVDYATTLAPGQEVLTLGCSVGFRAKLGSAVGFVTAGHCVTGLNQSIYNYGVVKKYRYSGNIDAAWIDLESSYLVGTALKYHAQTGLSLPIQNTPVTSFSVGQLYGKSGVSSKYTYGKITSLSASGSGGITGLVGTSVYATNGDSGGIVFKITGTGTSPTNYQTAGIVHGGPSGGGNMLFVKANNIVSTFGLTTY